MITAPKIGYLGQLGNQIFQYSALVGISVRTGYEIVIPFENKQERNIERDYKNDPVIYGLRLLDCFDLPDRLITHEKISMYIKSIYHESYHNFNPDIFNIKDNTAIIGYFETEKYFRHAKDIIIKNLKFKKEIIERATKKFNALNRGKKNVALHVRQIRKNACYIQQYHPFISLDYYKEALSFFLPENYDIIIFTDDMEWTKENIKGENIFYSEWDTEYAYPDFIDLYMMTLCDHHIIANSSFSWWGAWLANKSDQIVVAPSVWFGPKLAHKNTQDIIPERWIKI